MAKYNYVLCPNCGKRTFIKFDPGIFQSNWKCDSCEYVTSKADWGTWVSGFVGLAASLIGIGKALEE